MGVENLKEVIGHSVVIGAGLCGFIITSVINELDKERGLKTNNANWYILIPTIISIGILYAITK